MAAHEELGQIGARATADAGALRSGRGAPLAAALLVFSLSVLFAVQPARADDSIDPSLIPDGTYPAHVERVVNGQRVEVTMQGSLKVVLEAGRKGLTFLDKVKANDVIAVTLADGKVMAFNKK